MAFYLKRFLRPKSKFQFLQRKIPKKVQSDRQDQGFLGQVSLLLKITHNTVRHI